ncbi:MAG: hypothetical protein ACW99A_00505 [Candidatus Kariarchaeaceae archaeon]
MQSKKIIISLFIISVLVLIVPPHTEANDFSPDSQPLHTSQAVINQEVGHPGKIELNASVTNSVRNVTIEPSSQVLFEDQITLQIHDNETKISTFNYTLPTAFDKYVEEVEIWTQFDTLVAIDQDENIKSYQKYSGLNATTYFIDIKENDTAATIDQEAVHIKIRMTLTGAISWQRVNDVQAGSFTIPVHPRFPNLPLDVGSISVKLTQELDSFVEENITMINYDNVDYPVFTDASRNNLQWNNMTSDPFDVQEGLREDWDFVEIVFTSELGDSLQVTIPYVYSNAKRHLKVDPWGTIYVTEKLTVLHKGAERSDDSVILNLGHEMTSLSINVPREATITRVFDNLGTLNGNQRDPDTLFPDTTLDTVTGLQSLNVLFRNTIYGGEEYTFSLNYQFSSSDLLTTSGSNYYLNATIFSEFETEVYHLESTFELPAGAKLDNQNYMPISKASDMSISTSIRRDTLSFFRHLELTYTITNATYIDNYEFQIAYTYYGIGHFQYILTFILAKLLLLGLFVALNNVEFASSAPVDRTREKVPSAEIDAFFTLFTERDGAQKRLSDLRAKRKKGKVTKKEYDGQIKAIQRRVRELNPQLDAASKNLTAAGTRYQRLVDKIMISSQKQQDIKSNEANAKKSYMKGSTPKDIYQKLIRDYNKEKTKLQSVINKSLTELLEIDQEY